MKSNRAVAFSLIELLIVVTIIMILAGLLLPALRGVRKRACTIKCQSNLHDIGVALMLYEQDYSGFPAIGPSSSTASGCAYGQQTVYGLGGTTGTLSQPGQPCWGSNLPAGERPLNRYFFGADSNAKKLSTFHCCADLPPNVMTTSYGYYTPMWELTGNSYIYPHNSANWNAFGQDVDALYSQTSQRPYRRASLRAPAKKVMLYDEPFMCNRDPKVLGHSRHFTKSTSSTDGLPDRGQGNVLFADGSVRYVYRDRGQAISGGGNPSTGCNGAPAWTTNPDIPDPDNHDIY